MTTAAQKPDVEKDIREIIASILENKSQDVFPAADFIKDLGMDSMMILEVLAAVEKKYRIAIPEEILPNLRNLEITASIVKDVLRKSTKS